MVCVSFKFVPSHTEDALLIQDLKHETTSCKNMEHLTDAVKLQFRENFITPCSVALCFWPIIFRKCHPFQSITPPTIRQGRVP